MTVIALLNHPATPILMSDMLLSTDGGGSDIFLPALGDLAVLRAQFQMELPFKATRMARKPFNIGDHTFVAWAGSVSICLRFKEILAKACVDKPATQEDVDTAFYEMRDWDTKGFSVICVGLPYDMNHDNWRDSLVISQRNCIEFESKLYGKCLFGGSGARSLLDFVEARDDIHHKAYGAGLLDDRHAIAAASICGNLIFKETLLYGNIDALERMQSGQLLEDGCGGFYEAYTFANRAVRAPKPVLHIHIKSQDKGLASVITRLYYASNRNGMPFIVSLLAEPVEMPPDGEVFLGDTPIDIVACPPFDETKEHHHVRKAPTAMYEAGYNFCIDDIAVTLFANDSALPDGASEQLRVPEQIERDGMRNLRSQQFAFQNVPGAGPAELRFDPEDGFTLVIEPEWLQHIAQRFDAAHHRGPWHVDRTRA